MRSPIRRRRRDAHRARTRRRRIALVLALALLAVGGAGSTAATAQGEARVPSTADAALHPSAPWAWPGGRAQILRHFEAPEHAYGAGHRGLDVAVDGEEVLAPADGVVAFRGTVVDRPLITIDHGGGLVSTLEPVASDLSPGARVTRGGAVGTLAAGGHTPDGGLHLGARLHGEYVNPLALLGAAARPILLPCCDGHA